ncbi:hypothetical protein SDC9_51868 [bioreactor metagenome]|uniref:Uncharacterized protein n=1 Tax=bioreactor metagenome TaxID=1076179 RepID=A0A644WQ31_9ZZZZ
MKPVGGIQHHQKGGGAVGSHISRSKGVRTAALTGQGKIADNNRVARSHI